MSRKRTKKEQLLWDEFMSICRIYGNPSPEAKEAYDLLYAEIKKVSGKKK